MRHEGADLSERARPKWALGRGGGGRCRQAAGAKAVPDGGGERCCQHDQPMPEQAGRKCKSENEAVEKTRETMEQWVEMSKPSEGERAKGGTEGGRGARSREESGEKARGVKCGDHIGEAVEKWVELPTPTKGERAKGRAEGGREARTREKRGDKGRGGKCRENTREIVEEWVELPTRPKGERAKCRTEGGRGARPREESGDKARRVKC